MGNEASRLIDQLELLSSDKTSPSVQERHAWDVRDKSNNIDVKNGGFVIKLNTAATAAGAARGRRKYVRGTHFFEFQWEPGADKTVVVGIASDKANLESEDLKYIIGSDDQSVGWDLVSKNVYFNGCAVKSLPDETTEAHIPNTIIMGLDMNNGILTFSSKDQDYGRAMSGIKHISDELCIAASLSKTGDSIKVKYLGNADDVDQNVDGRELRFHKECGKNVALDNNKKTAMRTNANACFDGATVLTSRPLKLDEQFTLRLDKQDSSKWEGCWMIGLTTTSPLELNFPSDMSKCTQGKTWVYNENRIGYQTKVIDQINGNLDDLKEGATVAIKRSANDIKFYVDGSCQTSVPIKTEADTYGFVDLYGQTVQVTIVDSDGKRKISGLKDTISMPKTEEEFLERLTLTIALLKRKSHQYLPQVAKAVDINLNKVYHHFKDFKLRQTAAKKLADIDGPKIIHDFIIFLEQRGIEKGSPEAKLLEDLLSVCWNYCDSSLLLCQRFGECGFLDKLAGILRDLEGTYKKDDLAIVKVISSFGILHNCSKATENRPIYRRLDFVGLAQPYTNTNRHHYEIVMNAIMTISYVCEENHAELVELSDGISGYIVRDLAKAVDDPESHQHDGWHAYELAVGMTNLTINKHNIKMFVANGAIAPLIKMLDFADTNEIECALNALWSLVTGATLGSITYGEISTKLEKLKSNSNENIRAGVVRLETKLQDLTAKSDSKQRVGDATCEYAERCKRFWKTLNIPGAFFNEEFNHCYCARCHGKRGDKAYYSKGDPPKDYGIPVGWYRFGLRAPPQAEGNKAFEKWHRAYHGTKKESVEEILKVGGLVPPGRKLIGGKRIDVRSGHFNEKWKPEDFDIYQVFLSPSMRYAGINAYAKPSSYEDGKTKTEYRAKVAFQVLICPGSYKVGSQTVGAQHQIDPGFDNQELEWSTNQHGATILYGLLVKLEQTM